MKLGRSLVVTHANITAAYAFFIFYLFYGETPAARLIIIFHLSIPLSHTFYLSAMNQLWFKLLLKHK